MTNAYTLDEVHEEIKGIYEFFYIAAGPGVTAREEGHLGSLWAIHDRLVEEQREVLDFDTFEAEFGRGNRNG